VAALKREASDKDKENKLFMYSFVFPLGIIKVSFLCQTRTFFEYYAPASTAFYLTIIINILTDILIIFIVLLLLINILTDILSPTIVINIILIINSSQSTSSLIQSSAMASRKCLTPKAFTRVAMLHVARKQNVRDVHMARPRVGSANTPRT
jgi:hypothetical protein